MKTACAECGRPASLTVSEDGVSRWACGACADRRTLMNGLARLAHAFERGRSSEGVCPFCGVTEDDVRETGLVGCPLCYETLNAWEPLTVSSLAIA